MFKVGEYYQITIGTPEEYSSSRIKVLAWENPLIRYEEYNGDVVVMNTSSSWFFKAESVPSPEAVEAAEKAFFDKLKDA